ncbi:MAG: hypothetical protein MK033_05225 [Candidatus Caenarcaniphilales bacterium]|nr:hypothetical protein [Candidatus Caenarcaniphilales bacterium]
MRTQFTSETKNLYFSMPQFKEKLAEISFVPSKDQYPDDGAWSGDFLGINAKKTYAGQALIRNSIDKQKQEKLKELTKIFINKIINDEIPIINLMANGIESQAIKEYLLVYKPSEKNTEQTIDADYPMNNSTDLNTLEGDRNLIFWNYTDDNNPQSFKTLKTRREKDNAVNKSINNRINTSISGDYSKYNDKKSKNYITGHNHPESTRPSNIDLKIAGSEIALVLTQDSAYFIDYSSGPEDISDIRNLCSYYNDALSNGCLETRKTKEDRVNLDKEQKQEVNKRLQHTAKLLSCNISNYSGKLKISSKYVLAS